MAFLKSLFPALFFRWLHWYCAAAPAAMRITATKVVRCAFCKHATSITVNQWNFRYDTSFLCGTASNAIMDSEKNAFTFFGPSACTPGTGLIMTAFFSAETFDGDRAGITTNRVTLQYYDNTGPGNIFQSGADTRLVLTINQYEQQSRHAIGQFSSTALTAGGNVVAINAGNFKSHFD
jgi:hypothetical protein